MFYDRGGMHAAATCCGILKKLLARANHTQRWYDVGSLPTLATNGLGWFLSYAAPPRFHPSHNFILLSKLAVLIYSEWPCKSICFVAIHHVRILMHQYLFPQKSRWWTKAGKKYFSCWLCWWRLSSWSNSFPFRFGRPLCRNGQQ